MSAQSRDQDFGNVVATQTANPSTRVARLSLVKSYAKMFTLAVGFFLIDIPFFLLSSLTTSFSVDLGAFSLGVMYIAFTSFLFVTPSLVVTLGSKTCAIGSAIGALVFSLGYLYPTWYTLLPVSFVMGVSLALLYTILAVSKNDEVQKVVERYNGDPVTYQGRFSAIISVVGDGASSVLSGVVTFVILSSKSSYQILLDNVPSNQSFATVAASKYGNASLRGQACVTVTSETPALLPDSLSYYILVAVCIGASLICVIILSILNGAAYHKCGLRSYGPKKFVFHVVAYIVKVLQQGSTPEYILLLPLRLTHGFTLGYFQGVFTKMYITECVGVEFVGIAVIIWGVSNTLGGFTAGLLMRCMASYVTVLISIGLGQIGSFVFLIVWVRQPSFMVVVLISAIFGLCYGVNTTTALIYTGTAPGKTKEIGYNILVIMSCFGQMSQFFLSEYISVEANLYVILVTLVLAVPLFAAADHHFGSGRSRNCCGKKHVARGDNPCNTVSNSNQENGSSLLGVPNNMIASGHLSEQNDDFWTLMWKESTV